MSRNRLLSVVLAVCAIAAMAAASGVQARVSMPAPHKHHHARKHHRAKKHHRIHKHHQSTTQKGACVIHSLPSFVETGLGRTASSVADVITVECHPVFAEDTVTISSDELMNRCDGNLSWTGATMVLPKRQAAQEPIVNFTEGPSVDAVLDNDGEATVVAFGGPSCAAGTSLISAHLDAPPFTTATTTYRVIAPQDTPRGVFALPSSQVEDSVTSSAATIVYAEFNPVFSERAVTFRSNELYSRCDGNLTWVGPDETVLGTGPTTPTAPPRPDIIHREPPLTLDNNGNAWAVALGGPSCAAGRSTIEASLTSAPYTSYLTSFNILSPRVTNP